MYSSECVSVCQDILDGKVSFCGLHSPGLSLEGFEKHQRLLERYGKAHKAKKVYYT